MPRSRESNIFSFLFLSESELFAVNYFISSHFDEYQVQSNPKK